MKRSESCLVVSNSVISWSIYSLPGSSVYGILQVRILEWVPIPLSGGIFLTPGIEPGSPALQADSLLSEPLRKPKGSLGYCIKNRVCLILLF